MRKKASLAFIFIIILFIAMLFLIFNKGEKASNGKRVKRLNLSMQVTPISNSSLLLFDNGILIEGEGTNIKARGMDGGSLWSSSLENKIKDLLRCGEDLIVITEKNSLLTLNNSGKRLWQYEMPVTPASILSDSSNSFIIQYNWKGHNTFEIFSTEGEKLCSGIIGNAQILSYSSSSKRLFTVSLLDISSDQALSKVVTYDNSGEILWAINYDDVIAGKVKYGASDQVFIAGENFIKKYNSKGKMLNDATFDESISNIAISDTLSAVIIKRFGFYEIITFDKNLNKLGSIATKNKPDGIFAAKDEYLIYNKDNLSIADRYGKFTALYESNMDINKAYIHNDGNTYIMSNRRLLKLTR